MRQACLTHACRGILSAALLACADSAVAPVDDRVTPRRADTDATEVARGIALALASPELRAIVRDAMRESDVNEHKLVLQEFADTPEGRRLFAAAASALDVSERRLVEIVKGLPEFDFYAPFARHRREWRATDDVLVGATLDPENRYLDAYSIHGEAIKLDHEDGVPSSPLLILHPGEKKWRRLRPQPPLSGETIEGPDERRPRSDGVRQQSVGFNPDSVYIDEFAFGPGDGFGDSELRFEASFRRNSQTIATGRYEQGNVEEGERYDVTAPLIHLAPQPYSYDTLWVELWEDDCCGGDDYYGLVKFVSSDRLVEKCYHCLEITASIIRLDWFVGSNRIPSRIIIQPSPAIVSTGGTVQLTYTVADQAGQPLQPNQHEAPTWESFNTAVATVSSSGLVTGGSQEASTTVRITVCPIYWYSPGSPCKQETVPVHVQRPIANIYISPNPVNVAVGGSTSATATAYDANNQPIPGVSFTWQTDNPAIATVSGGNVYGVAQGSTVVRASARGRTGTATVNVTTPSSLDVSINGPGGAPPYGTCSWWASVSGGSGSYTYNWYVNGSWQSSNQDLYYANNGSNFSIELNVTDSNGAPGSATRSVTVSSSEGECPL
jgi:Big-like domain-containing protein